MADITASMVKELREATNAGMMNCKKALKETNGDMEKAIDFLREKGLAQAAKKSGRIAAEGLTAFAISQDGKKGVVVEVNSETDFVAKNEDFKGFINTTAKILVNGDYKDIEELKNAKYDGEDKTVQEVLTSKIATIGENMTLRRFDKVEVTNGAVVGYVHGAGKISVIVGLESEASKEELEVLGKDLAMQVAAMNPKYITKDDVDQEYLAHEREVLMAQALNEGKPQAIVEKMVEGRLNKELKEVCLVEQPFVKDSDLTVKKLIENVGKEIGKSIKLSGVQRFEVGEGLEKKSENFAEEVAKQINM
ncbi:elongation factor Ts [Sedimentibacter sp. zth1]|uniref:translation elongation factor Ts n=1 Tax=Sedimentibacter sp. zth1 TaxID=2816908 RepID=UPI001A92B5E5|nr:translation elongation factor Ts [Sedimentibacter sp. zth1]QSX06558.1 elongation factor Ts [Sedimentibacter sp. zth1]